MTLETNLWAWLSKARLQLGPALHIQRIENGVAAGTPDVEGYLRVPGPQLRNGKPAGFVGQFWIELKSKERPARTTTPVRFPLEKRDAQIEFLRHRWTLGANAFFLLQIGSGYERGLYLAPGDIGGRLRAGMTETEIADECAALSGVFGNRPTPADVLKVAATCRKSYRTTR